MKKFFTLAASALMASAAWAGVVTLDMNNPLNPTTIEYGDNSDEVLQIKQRMQELGYFSAGAELSGKFNSLFLLLFCLANVLDRAGDV